MAGATSINPTSLVELTISCRNLRDADVFSVSDPMAVVFSKPIGTEKWSEIARTECIDNNLNPDFVKKIKLTYFFEEQQPLKFNIYDLDSNSSRLDDHDFLGSTETTLGKIVSAGVFKAQLFDVTRNSYYGSIIVTAEELTSCKEELTLHLYGREFVNRKWFGSYSLFLEFYKANESGSFLLVHRTSPVFRSLNPVWSPFSVPLRSFCNGDYERTIKVVCLDHKSSGAHKTIGSFTTNVRMLLENNQSDSEYLIINKERQQRKGAQYKCEGKICVRSATIKEVYSFIDYLKGGCDLNAFIAIDFTASNGNPQDSTSLHYVSNAANRPNQYQQAIGSVVEVIEDYDTDKYFPVLGFGARLPPKFNEANHLFYVNGSTENPFCLKVQGVLDAYKGCINRVQLYGPTNFAPIIRHVSQFAEAHTSGDKYFILLIITDGIITDMELTKKEIVRAADLPLSIIIVGVGNANFDAMEELDGDVVRVSYNGKKASRDIVQFVPFREFQTKSRTSPQSIKLQLAREVLAEIPEQFVSFMKSRNIKPGNPETVPDSLLPSNAEMLSD